MKRLYAVLFSLAIALSAFSAIAAETQAQLRKEAKISMKKARSIALKKAPGKISSAELERENGKLIYSFDIKTAGQTGVTEVAVDAVDTTKIGESLGATEKKQEAKEKSPTKH